MLACPTCGAETPSGARFCPACGTALEQQPAPRELRKTVTVFFSDLVSSTELGERLDPESLRIVMQRYFDIVGGVLGRHGGTVEKFIGDAVMAVFGIPVAHEDDALRALRAAVEIRAALEPLNAEVEESWAIRIRVRTGINTGEVVTGDPRAGHALVVGDAVNVAARLEQAADPDEIVIGERTYTLARQSLDAEPLEPLRLKGKSANVAAWRVLALVHEAAERGDEAPLVGREAELARLEQALAEAEHEQRAVLVCVFAEAGYGKSRLARELAAVVAGRATCVRGRCLPYGEGITFLPLAEIVRQLTDGRPGWLDASLGELAANVRWLLGESERPPADAAETAWAVRHLVETAARERPLVLCFDDLQWAEPALLDLLEQVAARVREAPVLLLCLARPELLEQRPDWRQRGFELGPLSSGECEQLALTLAGDVELHAAAAVTARSRVVHAADGNPLFVEQMMSMLAEGAFDNGELAVPPSVQALVAARLDRLGGDERATLDAASVIGREFWRGAVEALSDVPEPHVAESLERLSARRLIAAEPSRIPGERQFRFRDLLLWDAAYGSLAKLTRADTHRRFATWVEPHLTSGIRELEELLAYHLEQAYRNRADLGLLNGDARAAGERAAELLALAGERALIRADAHAALNLLERAAALMPPDAPARIALELELGETLLELGRPTDAAATLVSAGARASAAGDEALAAHALVLRRLVELRVDPSCADAAAADAEAALRTFALTGGNDLGAARTWQLRAYVHFVHQQLGDAADALELSLVHARRAGSTREQERAVSGLCELALWGPGHVEEEERRVTAILGSLDGSRRLRAVVQLSLAGLHAMQGQAADARTLADDARAVFEDLGLTVALVAQAEVAGLIELLAGEPAAAVAEFRRAYELLAELGDDSAAAGAAAMLARALLEAGRADEAERFALLARAAAADADRSAQAAWRSVLAELRAARGEHSDARTLAAEAVEWTAVGDDVLGRGEALLSLARVSAADGRHAEAARAAHEAVASFAAKGIGPLLDRAAALAREQEVLG